MGKDVIVACDFASAEQTFAFLDKFTGRKPFVKIGMELYYAEGPAIVREIKARGHKIFLDLKLHDIPNTVKKAMAVLRNLDVDITNLHAAGATAMMQGALEGLTREDGTRPLLIAVTQLTSTDQETLERDLLIEKCKGLLCGCKIAGNDYVLTHYLTPPIISFNVSILYSSITRGRSSMIFLQIQGSTRLAAPTSTAVAPANIISTTSSALLTPPMPTTGILTAFATW